MYGDISLFKFIYNNSETQATLILIFPDHKTFKKDHDNLAGPIIESLRRQGLKVELNESSEMNFDFRRNLEKESTEFYSLAYNYLNDWLRAGVVFRRKFYEDRDIEHSDSLMFKISLIPLGDAFAPAIKQ